MGFIFTAVPATVDADTITFSHGADGSLTLSWVPPPGNVDSYIISYNSDVTTVAPTYTFNDLTPSTNYTFSITSVAGYLGSTDAATITVLTGIGCSEFAFI